MKSAKAGLVIIITSRREGEKRKQSRNVWKMQFSPRNHLFLLLIICGCFWLRLNLAQSLWAIKGMKLSDLWFEWRFGDFGNKVKCVCASMYIRVCVLVPSAITQGLRWFMLPWRNFSWVQFRVCSDGAIIHLPLSLSQFNFSSLFSIPLKLNCLKGAFII